VATRCAVNPDLDETRAHFAVGVEKQAGSGAINKIVRADVLEIGALLIRLRIVTVRQIEAEQSYSFGFCCAGVFWNMKQW